MFKKIGYKYIANQQQQVDNMRKHPALIGFLITAATLATAAEIVVLIKQAIDEAKKDKEIEIKVTTNDNIDYDDEPESEEF
jgi:hypothetical protein